MRLFLDTSALVKCYRSEDGSEWMSTLRASGNRLYVSPITEAELLAMLARERKQQPRRFHAAFDEVIALVRLCETAAGASV